MWECRYGKEPLNTRLFVLQLIKKIPVILAAAVLGAVCVGGPYFLIKVTFGPAKEYEAVTDFYIDYAMKEDGTQHTYINFATWDQLLKDDVFTDKILLYMAGEGVFTEDETPSAEEREAGKSVALAEEKEEEQSLSTSDGRKEEQPFNLADVEKAAGITKEELCGYLYATVLSDTRIVTTTVTTNDPELTMKIEKALISAMFDFGEQQREIAEMRILQEPVEASLVIADVRTFRACMVGAMSFAFVTVLYLCLYYALDESIYVPETFERRYGIPMLGTICSKELPILAEKLLPEKFSLLTIDREVEPEQVKKTLSELGIETGESYELDELFKIPENGRENETANRKGVSDVSGLTDGKFLLVVKAGAHNGKTIEKALDFCDKCGITIAAALLWEADEKLIKAYELPEHVFFAWRRQRVRE